ncbi:MAG TPA: hypothetical protein VGQ39_22500 [Pyrinomonadaceae bacterium]|jgi:hypothetical protein|nr:hypothetical protein [Pyrinomonadaceae bacterium]
MKRRLLLLSTTLLVAVVLAQVSVPSVVAESATTETQPVYTTPDGFLLGDVVPNAYAKLVRNQNGITTNVHTSLEGSGAYTVWWVVFNHPENCTTYLCTFDEPDIVVNATGHIVPSGGPANLSAWLGIGGPYSGEIIYEGPDGSLTNPDGALITLVVRFHGPALPGQIPEQLTTFLGGCPNGGAPCVDEQLVVFPGDCSGACLVPFP